MHDDGSTDLRAAEREARRLSREIVDAALNEEWRAARGWGDVEDDLIECLATAQPDPHATEADRLYRALGGVLAIADREEKPGKVARWADSRREVLEDLRRELAEWTDPTLPLAPPRLEGRAAIVAAFDVDATWELLHDDLETVRFGGPGFLGSGREATGRELAALSILLEAWDPPKSIDEEIDGEWILDREEERIHRERRRHGVAARNRAAAESMRLVKMVNEEIARTGETPPAGWFKAAQTTIRKSMQGERTPAIPDWRIGFIARGHAQLLIRSADAQTQVAEIVNGPTVDFSRPSKK